MKPILRNSLELLMLATIAITQPIFDLYGKNLPIFASAKISKYELGFFVCLVAVVPFASAFTFESIASKVNKRFGKLVHDFFIQWGGAEMTFDALAQAFPNNTIYAAFDHAEIRHEPVD